MGESHGGRSQGYIGIEMRDVSEDQLGELKLKDARGAEITNLDHDGPACKAGMRMHDVIVQMNGQVDRGRRAVAEDAARDAGGADGELRGEPRWTDADDDDDDGGPQDGGAAGVGAALLGAGAGVFGSCAGK